MAELGAEVALWARDREALAVVAAEVPRSRAFVVDVTDPEAIARARDAVRAAMPRVRVVVNNAGAVLRKPTAEISDAEWRRVIAVNVDGTFYVTRAFIPDLLRSEGRVINIASRAGREGTPLLAAYCAAKH